MKLKFHQLIFVSFAAEVVVIIAVGLVLVYYCFNVDTSHHNIILISSLKYNVEADVLSTVFIRDDQQLENASSMAPDSILYYQATTLSYKTQQNNSPPQLQHLHWTTTANGHDLFSAYHDSRTAIPNRPVVVLFGYRPTKARPIDMFCLLKFFDGQTKCVQDPLTTDLVTGGIGVDPKRPSKPQRYYCKLTSSDPIPTQVAVSTTNTMSCEPSSMSAFIPIQNNNQTTQLHAVGVCVGSPLVQLTNSRDHLQRLVEFIEMTIVLGGESVTLYSMNSSTWVIDTLLKRYSDCHNFSLVIIQWRMFEKWTPLHYYGQTLVINDCMYRNMYRVEYLAIIDLDEMIYPRINNWLWLTQQFNQQMNKASFRMVNRFFRPNKDSITTNESTALCNLFYTPTYFNWTSRVLFEPSHDYRSTKYFLRPEYVEDACVHLVCKHYPGFSNYNVPDSLAIVAHYRRKMLPEYKHRRRKSDETAMRFKDQVMKGMSIRCIISSDRSIKYKSVC